MGEKVGEVLFGECPERGLEWGNWCQRDRSGPELSGSDVHEVKDSLNCPPRQSSKESSLPGKAMLLRHRHVNSPQEEDLALRDDIEADLETRGFTSEDNQPGASSSTWAKGKARVNVDAQDADEVNVTVYPNGNPDEGYAKTVKTFDRQMDDAMASLDG